MRSKSQRIFLLILAILPLLMASCTEPLFSDQAIAPKHSITIDKSLLGCWQFKGIVNTGSLSGFSEPLNGPVKNNTTVPTTKPASHVMVYTVVIYPLDKDELLINMTGWPSFGVQVLTMRAWELQIKGQTYLNCELFVPGMLYDKAGYADLKTFITGDKVHHEDYIDSFCRAELNSMSKDGFFKCYILARIQKTQSDSLDVFPLVFPNDLSVLPSKGFESGEQLEQFLISPTGQKLLSVKDSFGTDAMHFKRISVSELPPGLGVTDN